MSTVDWLTRNNAAGVLALSRGRKKLMSYFKANRQCFKAVCCQRKCHRAVACQTPFALNPAFMKRSLQ